MNRLLGGAVAALLLVSSAACEQGVGNGGEVAGQQLEQRVGTGSPVASPATSADERGSNGVEQLPAHQVLARAREATSRAGSVQLTGAVREANVPVEFAIRLQGERAVGSISSNGTTVTVVKAGPDVYVQGDDTFYEQFGGADTATLLRGRWLKGSSTEPPFAGFAGLLDLDRLLDRLLPPEDALTKGGRKPVGGVEAVELSGEASPSTAFVALRGEPYLLAVEPNGRHTGKGSVRFSGWGQPVDIPIPQSDAAMDVSQLHR